MIENETREFKKTTGEITEGIISIVIILNKHHHGELFFGIKNDGTPFKFKRLFKINCGEKIVGPQRIEKKKSVSYNIFV